MADINFDCPHCGHNLEVNEKGAGLTVACPECSKNIEIPFPELPLQSSLEDNNARTRACPYCGEKILLVAVKCKHCGEFLDQRSRPVASSPVYAPPRPPVNAVQKYTTASRSPYIQNNRGSDKKILPLFLLFFFFGGIGIHAFYAGKAGNGVTYLVMLFLTGLGLAIGTYEPSVAVASAVILLILIYGIMLLIDFVRILAGKYQDGEGNAINQWT